MSRETKKDRPLKEYEIDVDVIDLDEYVKIHTRDYLPEIFESDETMFITFTPNYEYETIEFYCSGDDLLGPDDE